MSAARLCNMYVANMTAVYSGKRIDIPPKLCYDADDSGSDIRRPHRQPNKSIEKSGRDRPCREQLYAQYKDGAEGESEKLSGKRTRFGRHSGKRASTNESIPRPGPSRDPGGEYFR